MENRENTRGGQAGAVKRFTARRRLKKVSATLVYLVLTALLVIGGTVAYIIVSTGETKNEFTPGKVACEVQETFENNVKSDVFIKNTGNTEAFIRAYINVRWEADGSTAEAQIISAAQPAAGSDYELVIAENGAWFKGSDGFYYHKAPVDPLASTEKLIESCRQLATASVPEGCTLSVEIVASAIQSSPETVVAESWKVKVANGQIESEVGA